MTPPSASLVLLSGAFVPAFGGPCLIASRTYLRTKLRENSNVPLLSVWAMGLLGLAIP
jgi:hypothetical protein